MKPPQNGAEPANVRPPWWETAIMVGSFVALWVWYLLRQSAYRAEQPPSPLGSLLLVAALPLLLWVFTRRMQRVLKTLHEIHPTGRGPREPN